MIALRPVVASCAALLAAALLLGSGAAAQEAAPAFPAKETAAPTSPPMWRVWDEDSEIFLLGTFHILPPDLDWRTGPLTRAIDASETLWFEASVDTPDAKQQTLQLLMTEGFNKDGGKLSDILAPDDAERLTRIVNDLNLPLAAVEPMRPWQAFLTLSVQFIIDKGFDPEHGMDTVLLKEARARGRNLQFFETVNGQLGLFTSLPPEIEKDLLVFTLREWDEQAGEIEALYEAWRTGDIDSIDVMMNQPLRERVPTVFDALVTKRNEAWAETISGAMSGAGKELVAVGVGHMAGAGSVPALLAAKGFNVERYGVDAAAGESQPEMLDNDPIGDLLRKEQSDTPDE